MTLAAAALTAIVACGDGPTAPVPLVEDDPDIGGYVAGDAALALGADGRFAIPPDVVTGAEAVPIVSAAQARVLARAFTTSFGPVFHSFWERERGGRIDLKALEPSTRVYPLQTPYGAVPDSGCHPSWVRHHGSYYVMTLDDGGTPNVIMAVSAQTTEYGVAAGGDLTMPNRTGSDFAHEGVRRDFAHSVLLSPEQAVALAARATNAKVTSVPRLVSRGNEWSPTAALWRLTLDRHVAVVDSGGGARQTDTLYVWGNKTFPFLVPRALQPAAVTLTCSKVDAQLVEHGSATVTVAVREGPTLFERATIPKP
jgi:hypothetical protein